jgi:hypothetical protein
MTFRIPHASDTAAYKAIDELNKEHKLHALPFPPPRGVPEPRLTLQDALGGDAATIAKITGSGQIVFHSTGDCGSTKGPQTQNLVVDKMLGDFHETDSAGITRTARGIQTALLIRQTRTKAVKIRRIRIGWY